MPSDTTAKGQAAGQQAGAEIATINDQALLRQFGEMATMIPAETGDGTENILSQILGARTWDELDAPWETSGIDDIIGLHLRLTKVTRRPSTYGGGLGMFLVVHLTDIRSGKTYVKTTGSVAVVAQLAWLYSQGATAVTVQWCRADQPSANGYYPQHLKVIDAHVPGQGDGSQATAP